MPKGFTLLEIMIALAISGIVVACLFAVYNRTLEVGEQVKDQAGVEQNARLILSQLHKDLEALYYRPSQNASSPGPYCFRAGEGLEMTRQDAGKGTVLFRFGSTTSLGFREAPFPERKLFRVRYILRETGQQEQGPGTLLRSQLPFPEIRDEPSRIILSDRVSDISIAFVDASGREHSFWDSPARIDREGEPPLPKRILVELTLQSGEGTERTYAMEFALDRSGKDENG